MIDDSSEVERSRLLEQLQADEGTVLHAYPDPRGYLTIGCGRMIDERKGGGITQAEAVYLLENDVDRLQFSLNAFTWYTSQDSVRKAALVNMAFNLGIDGLLHFPHFLGFMQAKNYIKAVGELRHTPWHQEVGARADRIIHLIETGVWPC